MKADLGLCLASREADLQLHLAPTEANLRVHLEPTEAALRMHLSPTEADLRMHLAPTEADLRLYLGSRKSAFSRLAAPRNGCHYRLGTCSFRLNTHTQVIKHRHSSNIWKRSGVDCLRGPPF